MSLALRHNPKIIGLWLDENGWAKVDQLIKGLNRKGHKINQAILEDLVVTNDKKRYAFNADKTLIRANQGHSIQIDLALKEKMPPPLLFHGTVEKYLNAIFKTGLQKMSRQHVHLSKDIETATQVGSRRGKPIILEINAAEMHKKGLKFYEAENKVWLTEFVPPNYIKKWNV